MATLSRPRSEIDVTKRAVGSAWGWVIALGVVLIALGAGAFSSLPAATTVSVYAIGIYMLIGAGAQLGAAWLVRSWSGFGLLLSAVLYGIAGVLIIANPALAAQVLTLALAFSLMFSGAMRIWYSLAPRPLPGWGWITASGVVSVLAGIVFVASWPADAVYLLGMVLAIDLTFQGAAAIGWGLALRDITK